jgi:hypothetical protein
MWHFAKTWGIGPVPLEGEWPVLSLTPNPRQHYQLPMTNLKDLTTGQLHRIIAIKQQIETLQGEIDSIAGGEVPTPRTLEAPTPAKRRYHMSAAHRRKLVKALARARKIRRAKAKGNEAGPKVTKKRDRRSSPAVRAKLAAAARARWAKARAAGKTTL